MELDELKNIIQSNVTAAPVAKSAMELESILHNKTKSPIAKIKRNLLFEVVITYASLPFVIYFGFKHPIGWMKFYMGFMTAICIVLIIILTQLRKNVHQLQYSTFSLKEQLQKTHTIISEFVKRYLQFTILFFVFCLVLGFGSGFYDGYTGSNTTYYEPKIKQLPKNIWLLLIGFIIYVAALFAGLYYFTKWYLKKLYGKYLQQIQQLLNELEG
jgi:hypothetical protein